MTPAKGPAVSRPWSTRIRPKPVRNTNNVFKPSTWNRCGFRLLPCKGAI